MSHQTVTSLLSSKRSNKLAPRWSFVNNNKEEMRDILNTENTENTESTERVFFISHIRSFQKPLSAHSSNTLLSFLCALCGLCGKWSLPSKQQTFRQGFTLLELLLVLVIIGIGAALVGTRLGGLRDTASVDMAVKRLRDQARVCQDMAVANAQIVRLRVNTEQMTVDIEPINSATGAIDERHAPLITLRSGADDVTLTYERSDGVAAPYDYVDVLFYPDHRCDPPGRFTVASKQRFASVHIAAGAQKPTSTDSRPIEFRRRLKGEELQQ